VGLAMNPPFAIGPASVLVKVLSPLVLDVVIACKYTGVVA